MIRSCPGCDDPFEGDAFVMSGPGVEPRVIACSPICVVVGMVLGGLVDVALAD